MSTRDFTYAVNTVTNLLNQDRSIRWTQRRLAQAVALETGRKDLYMIEVVIKTLVTTGIVEGWMHRSKARNIQWKTQDVSPGTKDKTTPVDSVEHFEKIKKLEADLKEAQARYAEKKDVVVEVQLLKGKKTVKVMKDIFHERFSEVLTLAKARKNVFIYGPTGCGKSHMAEQVAKALDLPFAFVSCTAGMSEGQLGGRLLPVGKQGTFEYIISEFLKCYENGGVFLIDEMDAADSNVLLFINAAIANGRTAVPNRPDSPYAVRHPDFICMGAANTVGTGADRMYSGRNKLDASTLDRFAIGKVFMDYDERVDEQLCPNDELRNRLLGYRKAIRENRLERAMSTRFMQDAYDMTENFGWTIAEVDRAFFSGWREDEINKVRIAA